MLTRTRLLALPAMGLGIALGFAAATGRLDTLSRLWAQEPGKIEDIASRPRAFFASVDGYGTELSCSGPILPPAPSLEPMQAMVPARPPRW